MVLQAQRQKLGVETRQLGGTHIPATSVTSISAYQRAAGFFLEHHVLQKIEKYQCETIMSWFFQALPRLFIKYTKNNESQWHLDVGQKVIEFRKWNWNSNEPFSEGHSCSIEISAYSESRRKDNIEKKKQTTNFKASGVIWHWWEKYALDKLQEWSSPSGSGVPVNGIPTEKPEGCRVRLHN